MSKNQKDCRAGTDGCWSIVKIGFCSLRIDKKNIQASSVTIVKMIKLISLIKAELFDEYTEMAVNLRIHLLFR